MSQGRIGMIGSGGWASYYGRSLQKVDDIDLVAVAGGRRAPKYAETFGIRLYQAIPDLLADEQIEAVAIVTPHNTHRDLAVMAAEAGKHILVEKPMAMTPQECDEMIAAADANGVKLMVAHSRRYFPLVQRAKQIIDEGTIGDILMMRQTFCHDARTFYGDPPHWSTEQGGFFFGYGCHQVDMTFYLVGCGPKTVFGQFHPYWTDIQRPSAGQIFIVFENGAHTTLWDMCMIPDGLDQWPPFPEMTEENYIAGEKGLMILRPYKDLLLRTDGDWELVKEYTSRREADPINQFLAEEVRDLLKAVANDEEPPVPGYQGKWTVAAIQAAFESTRTGQAVQL